MLRLGFRRKASWMKQCKATKNIQAKENTSSELPTETLQKVRNMFTVNFKDARTSSMT